MRSSKFMGLVTCSVVAVTVPAAAQEAAPDAGGIEDIVVTAQKREQNLQDVPVAVSAVSGEALTEKGITQFSDLTQVSPSLTLTVGVQPANSSVVLRGVGTLAFSTGVEPSVAVVIDDLPVLQQAQAFSNMSDIERIEVLRGPQGTLFGKNSSAGVINISTRAPGKDVEGFANASVSSDGQYLAEGAVNVPLADGVAVRVGGFWQQTDGFIENLNTGNAQGGNKAWGLRARLRADVSDDVTLDLTFRRTHDRIRPAQTFRTVPVGGRIFNVDILANIAGITPGPENDKIRYTFDQYSENDTTAVGAKLEWDLGTASLISVTGYQKWKYFTFIDADNLAAPVFGSADGVYNLSPFSSRMWTQELRLASDGGGSFQYLAGLYFSDGKTRRNFLRYPFGSAQANDWTANNGTRTYAAFAQLSYDLTDTTHVDVGARYSREKIFVDFVDRVLPVPAPAAGNCLTLCQGDSARNRFTYKVSVRQDLTDGVMVYASYATGYKGQAYDISSGFNPTKAANPVRPETSKAYEIGLKSRFLENRAQLNLAVFRTDYRDFQAQSQVQLPNGTNAFNLSNVGKLRTQGVEVEATVKPVEALTLSATAAYTDAEMTEFLRAQCYPGQTATLGCVGGLQNLSGKRPPNSPKFRYTLSAGYDDSISAALHAFVQMDWRHQSATGYDLLQNPVAFQRGFGIFDAALGVREVDDRYRVTLFVKNLFDKAYAATILAPAGGNAGVAVQALPRDYRRYVGFRVGYNF